MPRCTEDKRPAAEHILATLPERRRLPPYDDRLTCRRCAAAFARAPPMPRRSGPRAHYTTQARGGEGAQRICAILLLVATNGGGLLRTTLHDPLIRQGGKRLSLYLPSWLLMVRWRWHLVAGAQRPCAVAAALTAPRPARLFDEKLCGEEF